MRYNDTIRAWLALYKYRGHEALRPLLGEMLLIAYGGLRQEWLRRQVDFGIDAVIPVPVSEQRLQERGFNQAERLASYVAEHHHLTLYEILCRARHSEKQSFKKRGERLRDSEALFVADKQATAGMLEQIKNDDSIVRLLLVDDIYTTGSTVNACAKAIIEGITACEANFSIEIYAITLARS